MESRNIFFLINSMVFGGAERQVSYLLEVFPNSKVICLEKNNQYNIPKNKIVFLSDTTSSGISKYFKIPIYLYKLYKLAKNEGSHFMLISFLDLSNLLNFFLSKIINISVILSVRNTISMHYNKTVWHKIYLKILVLIYKNAKLIVTNSMGSKKDLQSLGIKDKAVLVIPNMFNFNEIDYLASVEDEKWSILKREKFLLIVGRLIWQKGLLPISNVFDKLLMKDPNLKIVFVGEGEQKATLKAFFQKMDYKVFDINNDEISCNYNVYFLGNQKNPYYFMRNCSLFLLPSYYEGLPNVLIEAILSGAVTLSSDCLSGPREILEGSDKLYTKNFLECFANGFLLPSFNEDGNNENNFDNWENGINYILSQKENSVYIESQKNNLIQTFDIDFVKDKWINLLRKYV
jgi:glycosyltransferase involved in cell wall biosynthesis